jgi:hypothetical protein
MGPHLAPQPDGEGTQAGGGEGFQRAGTQPPSWGLPWRVRNPQEKGRKQEEQVLRSNGARAHPGSGSGKIRFDGSTEEELIEVKHASKTLTLTLSYLELLLTTAIRQEKSALLVIRMPGLRLECRLYREGSTRP